MKRKFSTIAAVAVTLMTVQGQDSSSKAWEFGIGGDVQSLKRIYIADYDRLDHADAIRMDERNVVFGAQLYVARELNRHFYLDFHGNFDFGNDPQASGRKTRVVITPTIGVQWRLGSYMLNKVIDPFVRVDVGYQYRNFTVTDVYNFAEGNSSVGNSSRHLSPVTFGAGTNLWISNNWGIGLEADYMLQPQTNVENQWQGAVRVIYRVGGEEKVSIHNQADLADIAVLNSQVNQMRSRLADSECVLNSSTL